MATKRPRTTTKNQPNTRRAVIDQPVAVSENRQRARYGGFNIGAAFFGWLVASGLGVMLTALLIALGSAVALSADASVKKVADNAATVGLVSGLLLIVAGAIAYYAGGYVAGRMSRFDGARQGFGVWLMGILLVIVLGAAGAIFGSNYNLLQQVNLPHVPIDQGNLTTGGVFTLLLSLLVTLAAAIGGGKVGEQYHRKVDRAGEV